MKLLLSVLLAVASCATSPAQTVYERQDGGVTVVEQSKSFSGDQKVEVRRYRNHEEYVNGEYKIEKALLEITFVAAAHAAPHAKTAWDNLVSKIKTANTASISRKRYPMVAGIDQGSAAAKAGIRPSDYLVSYNGHSLEWPQNQINPLPSKIEEAKGMSMQVCPIVIFRNGIFLKGDISTGYLGVFLVDSELPFDPK